MSNSLWPLVLWLLCVKQIFSLSLNSYYDSADFSKPPIFDAKKDKYFKIGGMFPHVIETSEFFASEGIQESIAFICGISSINNNMSILPNVTLIHEDVDPIYRHEEAVSSCVSYISQDDVTIVLGRLEIIHCQGTGSAFQSALSLLFLKNYQMGYIDFTAPNSVNDSPNYIRFNPGGFDISDAVVQLLKAMNWTLVSAIYGDYLYGTEVKGLFTNLANDNGITVVCSQVLPLNFRPGDFNTSNLIIQETANCLQHLSADVNIVVLFTSTDTTTAILDSFYSYPFLRDLTFVLASTSFFNIFNLLPYSLMAFPQSYILGSESIDYF